MPKIATTFSPDGTLIHRKFDKVPYKPSKDCTEKYSWNSFCSEIWSDFSKKYIFNFVDVDESYEKYFENCNDTAVFIVNANKVYIFELMRDMQKLNYDELHIIQLSKNQAIIRLWWD